MSGARTPGPPSHETKGEVKQRGEEERIRDVRDPDRKKEEGGWIRRGRSNRPQKDELAAACEQGDTGRASGGAVTRVPAAFPGFPKPMDTTSKEKPAKLRGGPNREAQKSGEPVKMQNSVFYGSEVRRSKRRPLNNDTGGFRISETRRRGGIPISILTPSR